MHAGKVRELREALGALETEAVTIRDKGAHLHVPVLAGIDVHGYLISFDVCDPSIRTLLYRHFTCY